MPQRDVEEVIAVIRTWQERRIPLAQEFSRDGLHRFAETHNALTRRLVSALGSQRDPEFYSALLELAQNASTLVAGGKLIVEGHDRTNA